MIYRLPSQTCHGGRLESSPAPPSILWMGTEVPCLQINRGTPAWNWLPKCHICHKAKQKVIVQDTGGGWDFVLLWLTVKTSMQISICPSIHASFRCPHAGLSSTLPLIQPVAYIHTQKLCSTISLSSVGYWAAALEQVVGKCFSKAHSQGPFFREVINISLSNLILPPFKDPHS